MFPYDELERAERPFLEPPEPQTIGRCYKCGWPVYQGSGKIDEDGACHYECEERY